MSTRELDRSLVTGIAWTAVFRWATQLVSWAATFYAVRILTPGDYGLVAMAMVPIGLARLIEDFGLDAVIVQNHALSDEQIARLGGFALLLGIGLAALFSILSPLIAGFFSERAVGPIVVAASLILVFDAAQVVPRALLQRELQFQKLAVLHGVQYSIVSIMLVLFATLGMGHWSLVLNTVVGAALATLVVIWMRPFRIRWPREMRSIAAPVMSGWRMFVARGAWYGYSNVDSTIVGRVLGKDQLGHYSFAMTLASLPIQEITALVSRVVPGVFSAAQNDRRLLQRYFLLITEALSYLTFPVAIGMALTADHIVHIALGDQWQDVIAPLRALSLYMAVNSAQVLVSHVLLWTGHFRYNMWFSLLALVALPFAFFVGLKWGIEGIAWSWVIAFPVVMFPAMWVAWRIVGARWSQYLAALLPAASGCAAMAVVVLVIRGHLGHDVHAAIALVVEVAAGVATYVTVLWLCYRQRLWRIAQIVRGSGRTEDTAQATEASPRPAVD